MVIKILKYLFVVSQLLSCQSVLEVETLSNLKASRFANYSIGKPSKYVVDNSGEVSFEFSFESGVATLQKNFIKQSSTGDSKCDVDIDDSSSEVPKVRLYNCVGNGRIEISYGDAIGHEFLVSNDSTNAYDQSWELNVSNDGKSLFVIDRTGAKLYKVDIATGVKTQVFSQATGLGDEITDIISFQLNGDETKLYGLNFSQNKLFVIDLDSKVATILSDDSSIGTDFNNLTRFIVDSNEQYAYVLDRDYASWRTIVKVDLSTGERTETIPDPYIKVSYGIVFGPSENIIYYTDRDNNFLYSVDLTSTNAPVILAENDADDSYNFSNPQYIVKDPIDSNSVYVLNWNGSNIILKVDLITGEKTLVAKRTGDGPSMTSVESMDISSDGKTIYVNDRTDDVIYAVDVDSGKRVIISK